MRAAVLTRYATAPAVREHPTPARSHGDVLIEVTAAPITPLDLLCASGTSYFGEPGLPYVPGVQGVGRVLESDAVPTGSRVWFPTTAGMRPGDGSLAELAVAAADEVVVLPDDVDDVLVAALGLSSVASWLALTWRGALRPGEQVLVLGAGGVVGQVGVQVAKHVGARRVVAACRSQGAQQRARAAGADAVVPLRDGEDAASLTTRLAEACDGPVDVVLDPLFGIPATAAAALLGSRGRLVNLGSSAGETAVLSSAQLRSHTASVLGYTNNDITREQRRDALIAVLHNGFTVGHDVVPLDGVGAAWNDQAAGRASQRLVVQVG
ncbi:MAG TPA: zinc-binding dehydrogenase [Actinomycetales bacterium]|nr:zinc-binding dehydrogenase [Actinomycetales bacterium]